MEKDRQRSFEYLDKMLPELEALYKDVHAHPELSMQEKRTAGIAADHLRASGFEVTTGVGKTGVVGILRNGDGPTVMLRADMDALPIKEATGLPYASSVTRITVQRSDLRWLRRPCRCCFGIHNSFNRCKHMFADTLIKGAHV